MLNQEGHQSTLTELNRNLFEIQISVSVASSDRTTYV